MRQRPQRPLGGALDPRRPGRAKHGATAVELALMLRTQGGRCAICGADIRAVGAAHVDHDHALAARHDHPASRGCGLCRRSLLCVLCNTAIGYGRDDPALLRRMASYLEHWSARLGR